MAERATHYRWDDLPREQLSPLIGRRLITGDQMMIAHVYLAKDAVVPQHSHHNEQLTYIIEGKLRFFLGDDGSEVVDVAAGGGRATARRAKSCTPRRTSRTARKRSKTHSTWTSSTRPARTGWTVRTRT